MNRKQGKRGRQKQTSFPVRQEMFPLQELIQVSELEKHRAAQPPELRPESWTWGGKTEETPMREGMWRDLLSLGMERFLECIPLSKPNFPAWLGFPSPPPFPHPLHLEKLCHLCLPTTPWQASGTQPPFGY